METIESPTSSDDQRVPVRIVDADVHPMVASPEELREYLPEPWRSLPESQVGDLYSNLYLPPAGGLRKDATPPDGKNPASDPVFVERQLLLDADVDFAILITPLRINANPILESAQCIAMNEWTNNRWLSSAHNSHGRYWGSINVNAGDPEAAVREIERWAGHPHFIQVRVNAFTHAGLPFGHPFYHPIYEAASRHSLPIAVHFTGLSLLTPVGFLSYYFEHHSLYSLTYAAHLVSLICEGVFDKFERLKFVFVEGGFSWVLPVLWRLEDQWDEFRSEMATCNRRPWEYVREQVRFTTQPIEEPRHPKDLIPVAEQMKELLLFSTDYPHWDYDHPSHTLKRFPSSFRERIACRNALDFYDLPDTRLKMSDMEVVSTRA